MERLMCIEYNKKLNGYNLRIKGESGEWGIQVIYRIKDNKVDIGLIEHIIANSNLGYEMIAGTSIDDMETTEEPLE